MTTPPRVQHESEVSEGGPSMADLAAVLARAGRGDNDAWREIIALYGRRVFALAKSRLVRADLAEEVTQSVFVTVAGKLGPSKAGTSLNGVAGPDADAADAMGASGLYTEQGKFEAWLFRVAVNRIRDEVRKLRRHATPTDPEVLADHAPTTGNKDLGVGVMPGEASGEVLALRRAMATLGESDREVIELRHHAGMSFAQMAQMVGEPLGTLLARHHRALRKLKAAMEEAGSAE